MAGRRWIQWILLGAAVGLIVAAVIGHVGKASPRPEKSTSAMLAGVATQPLARKPVGKPAPRESAFSTYANGEYGASFRYPRNYPLDEGPLDEASESTAGLRNQADLETEQPGGILVATIAVPDDSFPNTTFAGGSVQFAVNRYLAGEGCRQYPVERLGDAHGPTGMKTIQDVPFAWADSDAGEGDTEFIERDYAGFANGTCYEFFVRVGTSADAGSSEARPANQKKILGQLEKIVESLQFQERESSMLDRSAGKALQARH
jgi:hypothetical protein